MSAAGRLLGATAAGLETAGAGTSAGLWAARLANHLSFVLLVGLLLTVAWLAVREDGQVEGWARRLATPAAGAALLWCASALALFVFSLSEAAARALPEALRWETITRFAATRTGTAQLLQAAWALMVAALASTAHDRRGGRWALLAAALGALAPAWWGHAAGTSPALLGVGADWLHILGAGAWVGGLLALLLLARAADGTLAGPVGRFSSLAGLALVLVAVTGVVGAALHTTEVDQLLFTTWGRLALVKAGVLVLLGVLGWLHRRRSLPALRAADGAAATRVFRRLAGVELVVMLTAVGLATSMAVGVPADTEAALSIPSVTTALGDGQVNVTLDPGRRGSNELHVYVFAADGSLRPVEGAEVELRAPSGARVAVSLFPAGPGHFTAPSVEVDEAGAHTVTVAVRDEAGEQRAELTVTLR